MSATPERHSVAALIGNGMSIAYNPDLTIPRITDRIIHRLDTVGDQDQTQQSQLMRLVAERAGRTNVATDFEQLVSPFDELRDTLPLLGRMADLAGQGGLTIRQSIRDTAAFARLVYRHGVSHVLDVIAEHSTAREDQMGPLRGFIDEIMDVSGGGDVTYGNLNYDSLLMAAICRMYDAQMCDMTDGRHAVEHKLITPEMGARGRPLRSRADLPMSRHVALVHLHGSLAWLREPSTGIIYRFDIDDVRSSHYWTAWREGRTDWSPVVVLTNQAGKSKLIKEYPFALGYDIFEQRLLTADKWLIAGTSLQDVGVNRMLKDAWRGRATKPQVLVVTKGAYPTDRQIQDSIGYDPIFANDPDPIHWLNIFREGVFAAPSSMDWFIWSNTAPVRQVAAA